MNKETWEKNTTDLEGKLCRVLNDFKRSCHSQRLDFGEYAVSITVALTSVLGQALSELGRVTNEHVDDVIFEISRSLKSIASCKSCNE